MRTLAIPLLSRGNVGKLHVFDCWLGIIHYLPAQVLFPLLALSQLDS